MPYEVPPHHLVTHGVVLGMTGSGKTGLLATIVEEAIRSGVPVLAIDVKGDLPNLFLAFPDLAPADFAPWIDAHAAIRAGREPMDVATATATAWRDGLASWGLGPADVASLASSMAPRLLAPGASFAEPIHVLSALERRSPAWGIDDEAARDELAAAVSLLLRLSGREGDPRAREHVVLSALAERRLLAGGTSTLADLLGDLANPPIATLGALAFDDYIPEKERRALLADLNSLLASPKLQAWLKGAPLDPGAWLAPRADGRTPLVVATFAHLDDEDRATVLAVVLDAVLAWVRSLSGTSDLRALIVIDEAFGMIPPHPASPPTKPPILALLKQARAFGVGLVLATQNTTDLDYKALSNAGAWMIGRLSTDGDRARVVEGLAGAGVGAGADLDGILKALPSRTFFVRDIHRKPEPTALVETRWCLSWLRGPMTRKELGDLARKLGLRPAVNEVAPAAAPSTAAPPAEAAPPAAQKAAVSPAAAPTLHAGLVSYVDASATSASPLVPRAVGVAVVRLRDAALGLAFERKHVFAGGFDAAGKVDPGSIVELDSGRVVAGAPPTGSLAPLPAGLGTKAARASIEKALKDHASLRVAVEVQVSPLLGVARADGEAPEAFAERLRAAAEKLFAERKPAIAAKYATRITKAAQRRDLARMQWQEAHQRLGAATGAAGEFFLGLVGGKRAAGAARTQRGKTETALDKARDAAQKADSELLEEQRAEATEQQLAHEEIARALETIEVRRLLPKRGDVEISGLGIVWMVD